MSADLEDQVAELTRAYSVVFGSPAGQLVLADLDLFCHTGDPLLENCKDVSDRRLFMNEGRREVALRILKFAKATLGDIYDLRLGRKAILRSNEGEPLDG